MNCFNLSLSMKQSEIILNQMKNCVCLIYKQKKKIGTGFISGLTIKNELIPLLIAHSNIFSSENFGKEIQLELFDGKQKNIKIIYFGFRKLYVNKNSCLAIIELKKNLDKINDYIELENDIFIKNPDKNESIKLYDKYFNDDAYILNNLNNDIIMSVGNITRTIKEVFKGKNEDSFLPIISSKSNKLIGIYSNNLNDNDNYDNYFCIKLLKNSIDEFVKIIISSTKEIKMEKPVSIIEAKKLNELSMIYNIKNCGEKLTILGKKFVSFNKDKCYLKIDQHQFELSEELLLNQNINKKDKLEIKLIIVKPIDNMSCFFNGCNRLLSISGFSSLDFEKITNISYMFYGCHSLESLSEPAKIDKGKITSMNDLFNMKSLDISSWDTKNVSNMGYLFAGCSSLKFLPDISKWKTDCVTNMSYLFAKCTSLKTLPDISKWNTKNVDDMSYMFAYCGSLKSLPDLSKWDTGKVINIIYILYSRIN